MERPVNSVLLESLVCQRILLPDANYCAPVEKLSAATQRLIQQSMLYNVGVYTTLLWPSSEQTVKRHLQRVLNDGRQIGLDWPIDDIAEIYRMLEQALLSYQRQSERLRVRISLLALIDTLSAFYAPGKSLAAFVHLQFQEWQTPEARTGLNLKMVLEHRDMAALKHTQIAKTILLQRQARQEGFDDILYSLPLSEGGILLEAGFSNVILADVENKKLLTPDPSSYPCLAGTTVSTLFEQAVQNDWHVEFGIITTLDLCDWQACLISNAVVGLQAVQGIVDASGEPFTQFLFSNDAQTCLSELMAA